MVLPQEIFEPPRRALFRLARRTLRCLMRAFRSAPTGDVGFVRIGEFVKIGEMPPAARTATTRSCRSAPVAAHRRQPCHNRAELLSYRHQHVIRDGDRHEFTAINSEEGKYDPFDA
jgi:hypothetical protein